MVVLNSFASFISDKVSFLPEVPAFLLKNSTALSTLSSLVTSILTICRRLEHSLFKLIAAGLSGLRKPANTGYPLESRRFAKLRPIPESHPENTKKK